MSRWKAPDPPSRPIPRPTTRVRPIGLLTAFTAASSLRAAAVWGFLRSTTGSQSWFMVYVCVTGWKGQRSSRSINGCVLWRKGGVWCTRAAFCSGGLPRMRPRQLPVPGAHSCGPGASVQASAACASTQNQCCWQSQCSWSTSRAWRTPLPLRLGPPLAQAFNWRPQSSMLRVTVHPTACNICASMVSCAQGDLQLATWQASPLAMAGWVIQYTVCTMDGRDEAGRQLHGALNPSPSCCLQSGAHAVCASTTTAQGVPRWAAWRYATGPGLSLRAKSMTSIVAERHQS